MNKQKVVIRNATLGLQLKRVDFHRLQSYGEGFFNCWPFLELSQRSGLHFVAKVVWEEFIHTEFSTLGRAIGTSAGKAAVNSQPMEYQSNGLSRLYTVIVRQGNSGTQVDQV